MKLSFCLILFCILMVNSAKSEILNDGSCSVSFSGIKFNYYELVANNECGAVRQILDRGPVDKHGKKRYAQTATLFEIMTVADDKCRCTSQVKFTASINAPMWNTSIASSNWSIFLSNLIGHELRHATISLAHARELQRHLCSANSKNYNFKLELLDWYQSMARTANDEFDRKSLHGFFDGVNLKNFSYCFKNN